MIYLCKPFLRHFHCPACECSDLSSVTVTLLYCEDVYHETLHSELEFTASLKTPNYQQEQLVGASFGYSTNGNILNATGRWIHFWQWKDPQIQSAWKVRLLHHGGRESVFWANLGGVLWLRREGQKIGTHALAHPISGTSACYYKYSGGQVITIW